MAVTLTYLQFHAVLIVPVIVALALTTTYRLGDRRTVLTGTVFLAGLAALYTTPWDHYLIARGAWWYGSGAVAVRFWQIPLGEYLFFLLQPVIVGLWVARFRIDTDRALAISHWQRLAGVGAAAVVAVAGLTLLSRDSGLYLGLLLAWSAPILGIQWAFGWPFLVDHWRTVVGGTLGPTIYLCLADRLALELDIWILSTQYTTGVELLGLPIEEATFFLLTSLFVVQGLVLYCWLVDQWG